MEGLAFVARPTEWIGQVFLVQSRKFVLVSLHFDLSIQTLCLSRQKMLKSSKTASVLEPPGRRRHALSVLIQDCHACSAECALDTLSQARGLLSRLMILESGETARAQTPFLSSTGRRRNACSILIQALEYVRSRMCSQHAVPGASSCEERGNVARGVLADRERADQDSKEHYFWRGRHRHFGAR